MSELKGQFNRIANGGTKLFWGESTVEGLCRNQRDMARQLSVNRRTIQRGLEVLKSRGMIERKGGKRYGYWEVYE